MSRGPDGPRQRREHERRNSRPSFMPPQVRRLRFNAPFPAAGGGMGCPLASRPAKGARAGLGGCARCPLRGSPDGAALRSRTARAPTNRRTPTTRGRRRRRVNDPPRQGPRAKILVRINDVVDEPLARGRMHHQEFDRPAPIGRALSQPRSTRSCRPRRSRAATPRRAWRTRSHAAPWAACAASCATI